MRLYEQRCPCKCPIIEYTNGQYQLKVPFIIYAYFELILEPISGPSNKPEMPSTRGVISILYLVGALDLSLLMGNLRLPQPYIENQIVLRNFVNT